MSELQVYLAEKNGKKQKSLSGSSVAAADDSSDTTGLLSWMPSSTSISMPSVFKSNSEQSENSSWFSEAKSDPCCPALVSYFNSYVFVYS